MIKTYNPDFKNTILKRLEGQQFMNLMGFQITRIEEGHIEGRLDIQQVHKQQYGYLHGGAIATMADIVAGFAAYSLVAPGYGVVTGEIKISYFNPGIGDTAHAIGKVLKQGRKVNFCESEIWTEHEGKRTLIAKASATMITIEPKQQ